MAYDIKRVMAFGAAGVLIATLIIISVTLATPLILRLAVKSIWYTEIEAVFNTRNPEIVQEGFVVKNRLAKGVFLDLRPSVQVEEKQKITPSTGIVNFTTVITLLNEDGGTVWSYTSNLAGFGRKHFDITLPSDIMEAGETYTIRFTTTLKITPFAGREGGIGKGGPPFGKSSLPEIVLEKTKTFERTFTLLDKSSQERLKRYIEEPGEDLDQDYYYWLLQTLYEHKGSYFMDRSLDVTSTKAAFEYVYKDIAYKKDLDLYGRREYFANASETMENKAGDCEDKAILLASTLYWRAINRQARVVAGEVSGKGHAWVEVGDHVYDPTNNIIAQKSDYYTYVTAKYFYFTYNDFNLLSDTKVSIGS